MTRTRSTMCLFAAALLCAGCSGTPTPVPYARPYPAAPSRGPTLDIQVVRETRTLTLTNTTARAFGPSTLWLNARFSYPVESLAVGESLSIPLRDFRDEFSGAFRGGGFFATERPDTLVLAELETPRAAPDATFFRLVVVRSPDEL